MSRSFEDVRFYLMRGKRLFVLKLPHTSIFLYTKALIWLCNRKSSASPSAANKHETAHK